uniref:Uncharacterized protein n=1 Tax=Magnetococcus massalia (strain MO-1) TaxID=451514 RepID=A0A1S7LDU8_MAGMO|nr:protein of unknown function [Candidatus Magnetococcus massalia]
MGQGSQLKLTGLALGISPRHRFRSQPGLWLSLSDKIKWRLSLGLRLRPRPRFKVQIRLSA